MPDDGVPTPEISPFVLGMILNYLKVYDQAKRQTVTNAIPVADKMVQHVNEQTALIQDANAWAVRAAPLIREGIDLYIRAQPFIATEWADWKIVGPAVQIILDAMAGGKASLSGTLHHLSASLPREHHAR